MDRFDTKALNHLFNSNSWDREKEMRKKLMDGLCIIVRGGQINENVDV